MQAKIKTDDIGFLSHWPPEAKEIFGFEEYEVNGWYLGVFIHSIEKMDDEKRKSLGLEHILDRIIEKKEKISFSTINIRSDLKAFYNTVEIVPDEEGTTANIIKGDDTDDIKRYNELIDSKSEFPLVVSSRKGRIFGVNDKFAIMAKFNRMRLINRPLGLSEEATIIDLAEMFDSLDGLLLIWPSQER